ncbi:unnamed protein product [Cuscuta campestris]|uniref:Leucine-rich repeat-containing N-terminal plant-type domain-containing protein n=1 Tax=Cuscuta campestris TaxID=132261 RepID=A0A484MD02_9ASTE|nr:unnamed protein product [Cuscuta campestris]
MASTVLLLLFAAAAAAAFTSVAAVDDHQSPDSPAMYKLKASLEFPPGSQFLINWNNVNDTCKWAGVRCDGAGRVWQIVIENYGLKGTFPEAVLRELPCLSEFYAGRNNFTSFPPDLFRNLSNLETLSLDYNIFLKSWQIPETLTAARKLKFFSAAGCNINGRFPEFLTGDNFPALQHLHLSYNSLSGHLPSQLPTTLRTLWLNHQDGKDPLSGGISVLQGMKRLSQAWLHVNTFSGEIPDLSGLTSLQDFLVGYNCLTGTVPETMASIPSLQNVNLAHNHLTGTIPRNINRLTGLLTLDLSYNQLSGCVPTGFLHNVTVITDGNVDINGKCPPP